MEDLVEKKLDLGFLTGPVQSKNIAQHIIHTAPYVAALPLDHWLSELDEIPLKLLEKEDFVVEDNINWRHFIPQLNAVCIEAGFIPKISRQAPNTESIFGLVTAKMRITLYPDFDLNYNRQDITIRPVKNGNAYTIFESAWKSQTINPTIDQFLSTNQMPLYP